MALGALKRLIRQDVALDLGTANSLIFLQDEGVVLNQPTTVAMDRDGRLLSFGEEAKRILGKNPPDIKVVRPMRDGVINDFEAVGLFMRAIVEAARRIKPVFSSKIVICVPSQLTQVEKRLLLEAARSAGFKKIFLIEEVMAAAIGAGVDVSAKRPCMVADIGGGTTEVAVISEMAYLFCHSRRVAGDEMDQAIMGYMLKEYGLRIGPNTAEKVKWEIGSATGFDGANKLAIEVAGQDLRRLSPTSVTVGGLEIQKALSDTVDHVISAIQDCLFMLSEELRREIEQTGLLLTGGGSMLRGLSALLTQRTGVQVSQPMSPLTTVVEGAGKTLSDFAFFNPVFVN